MHVLYGYQGKHCPDRSMYNDRRKYIIIVNRFLLWVPLFHKTTLNFSPFFCYYRWFSPECSFKTDVPCPIRKINKLPCLIFVHGLHLLHHCINPLIFLMASYSLSQDGRVSKTKKKWKGYQFFISICWLHYIF